MFFHVAGLFVTLHAEFLAIIQILVYAGAILVLYLFVVMLLNLKREEHFHRQLLVGVFLGCVLFAEAVLLVLKGETTLGKSSPAADSREGTLNRLENCCFPRTCFHLNWLRSSCLWPWLVQ
jgi:NADH-quinone oxidoreductase subunit J